MQKFLFVTLFALASQTVNATWHKVNDLDYTWGPFKIYNIALSTETGEYQPSSRPLMLTLKYEKPVDGRDFAISIAKSWKGLGIKLSNQEDIIDRLRKVLPDFKPNDTVSYIALEDRGYFVVNDQVIAEELTGEANDAILAIWLDKKVELSHKLTAKKKANEQGVHIVAEVNEENAQDETGLILPIVEPDHSKDELKDTPAHSLQAVDFEPQLTKNKSVKSAEPIADKVVKPAEQPIVQENKVAEMASDKQAEPTSPATEPKLENQEKSKDQQVDPENPEVEIRGIEDPTPRYYFSHC